jgi:hypothetical protein
MDCYGTSANAKALHVDVHIHVISFQYRYFEILKRREGGFCEYAKSYISQHAYCGLEMTELK